MMYANPQMNRLNLNMSPRDCIVKMCDGNPGALNVMINLLKNYDAAGVVDLFILDEDEIYGSNIWILYKDICGEDITKTHETIVNREAKTRLTQWAQNGGRA